MARHRLDLLPLLDVFMVVLFVFATIQEQKLGDSARDAVELAAQASGAEQALAAALAREQALRDEHHAVTREHGGSASELEQQVRRLRQSLAEAERARDEAEATQVALEARAREELRLAGTTDDDVRRNDVLSRLLDRYSVFEIEISGALAPDGSVHNRCCYRADPLHGPWRSCGHVPALEQQRERWLGEEAAVLEAALRRTRGGNAMTLIRNDRRATYEVGHKLGELLRERFADHQVYVVRGSSATPVDCEAPR